MKLLLALQRVWPARPRSGFPCPWWPIFAVVLVIQGPVGDRGDRGEPGDPGYPVSIELLPAGSSESVCKRAFPSPMPLLPAT